LRFGIVGDSCFGREALHRLVGIHTDDRGIRAPLRSDPLGASALDSKIWGAHGVQ
jgi:hypothetical protein